MRNSMFRSKRTLLVESLYVVVWVIAIFIVVPHACRGLAYSIFYQQKPDRSGQLRDENTQRVYLARNILAARNYKYLFDRVNVTNDLDLCIVIPTVSRPGNPRYLSQTVASIAHQLEGLRGRYSFAVYNVGGDEHTEAFEVSRFVPVIHNRTISTLYRRLNAFQKQKIGYTSAMKWCLRKNARFNLILEDDVIVDRKFVSNFHFIMNYCLADKQGKKWGFLKLYYPEKYQGWGNSPSNVVELLLFTLLLGFGFTYAGAFVFFGPMAIDTKKWKIYTKRPLMYFRLAFTHFCILFVLLSIGRPHWEEIRKTHPLLISVVEARGCCIPAVVYPRTHFKELIDFMDSRTASMGLPHDLIIDQFIAERGLKKLLAVPNLVNHIGMISSLEIKGQKHVSEFDLLFPPSF